MKVKYSFSYTNDKIIHNQKTFNPRNVKGRHKENYIRGQYDLTYRREEVKLFLFTSDIIVYAENPMDYTRKATIIIEASKVV